MTIILTKDDINISTPVNHPPSKLTVEDFNGKLSNDMIRKADIIKYEDYNGRKIFKSRLPNFK